jgi:hypothetical protein
VAPAYVELDVPLRKVVVDGGPEFKSELVSTCRRLGIYRH